jgi:predicted NAD/FAD-dependent oxidoreductase
MNNDNKILLFLDIDGVTHPVSGSPIFLPECMSALQLAIEQFNVELVISSSWRESKTILELEELLKPLNKNIQGVTPVIDDPFLKFVRYHEVKEYLKNTNQQDIAWLALDDSKGFYPNDAPVYWVDSKSGFTREDISLFTEKFIFHVSKSKTDRTS